MKIRNYARTAVVPAIILIVAMSISSRSQQPDQDKSKYIALMQKPATIEQAERQARELMQAMTPEERFNYVTDMAIAVPRLGIPGMIFSNASGGYTVTTVPEMKMDLHSTAFPCTLLLAATWDLNQTDAYARAVAEEFRFHGSQFILGPGMNMYRNSLCGRNFEYLGEDPWLASEMVATYVRGAQSLNVGTTLKHFVTNETENYRHCSNSVVSERALNEIYYPPFKAGIQAGAWGLMTSYNLTNGEWNWACRARLIDVLRKTFGFKFLIMTDWGSAIDGVKVLNSGEDMEMPGGFSLKRDREKALGSPQIDNMVVEALKTFIYSGLFELMLNNEYKKPDWISKYPQHAEVARQTNEEGIVLLKNSGILPLETVPDGKILVTGNQAMRMELSGSGSGHVKGYDLNTYLDAVRQKYGVDKVVYAEKPTDDQIRSAGLVLLFTGRLTGWGHQFGDVVCEGEGWDHVFALPEDDLIAHCVSLNPKTVVSLVCGGGAQMDWADKASAIVLAFYGGQTGPGVLMDILTGKVNPSGKLPFTIEKHFEDSCAADLAKPITPLSNLYNPVELGKLVSKYQPRAFLRNASGTEYYTYDVNYAEGVFMGYRWYEQKKIEPRFPFGYGLSYTTFEYSNLQPASAEFARGGSLKVEVTVKNTGSREGDEIAQLYVSELKPTVPRPPHELKEFQRVRLQPGESKTVTMELHDNAFSYYDEATHSWQINPGAFEIQVGASSADIKLRKTIQVE